MSSLKCADKSDQKATNILLTKIFNSKNNDRQERGPSVMKGRSAANTASDENTTNMVKQMRQCSIKGFVTSPSSGEKPTKFVTAKAKRVRKPRETKFSKRKLDFKASPKITSYVKKNSHSEKSAGETAKDSAAARSGTAVPKDKKQCKKRLQEITENGKASNIGNSNTYEKYGMKVPSFENILKQQKEFHKYKHSLNKLKLPEYTTVPQILGQFQNGNAPETIGVKRLDCKHLTLNELEAALAENDQYVRDILDGKRYSDRHERLKKVSTHWTDDDLTFNTSMITFDFEQKRRLIKLLQKQFGDEQENVEYFFRVLLPEVCFKIFMDVHKMDYDHAMRYLDAYPVTEC